MNVAAKGVGLALLSSTTFGLSPLFTVRMLHAGLSSFEVLAFRWGVAALALALYAVARGERLRMSGRDLGVSVLMGLLRAVTSFSLVVAYADIASGAASTIHFLYPLAVAAAMMLFFGERASVRVLTAIAVSVAGAALLSYSGAEIEGGDLRRGTTAAVVSIFSYAAYIIAVRKTRAAKVESTVFTLTVMGTGALLFACCGMAGSGIRIPSGPVWWDILCIAVVATAISNIALVKAVKSVGPTLTSILGAMEPVTAMVVGVLWLGEPFTLPVAAGMAMVIGAVTLAVSGRTKGA